MFPLRSKGEVGSNSRPLQYLIWCTATYTRFLLQSVNFVLLPSEHDAVFQEHGACCIHVMETARMEK